ncbi:MAG: helix-turn-helix domain-containing protein [Chryseolinea sp.]
MAETVNERLESLIKILGTTRNNFAKTIGFAATVVYNICNGRNAPSYDLLLSVAEKYPSVSMEWLIAGRGTPLVAVSEKGAPGKDMLTRLQLLEEKLQKMEKPETAKKKK